MATDPNETVLRDFRETTRHLRDYRGMYVGDGFEVLVALIVGYSEATKRAAGVDLMSLLQEYLKADRGVEFSLLWPYYILNEEAGRDEEKATLLVFSCVDEFVSASI